MAALLPYGRHRIDDDDVAAVAAVLRGDWLTDGPAVRAFEHQLAATTGAAEAVACANGTAALHLAALALDLGPGDWVVAPAVTFVATANCARFVGAEVVFADVDPDSGLITPDSLAAAISRAEGSVKAVLPVHLNGHAADMAALAEVAPELAVVEDACHALGTRAAWGTVGACPHSAMTVFSFHPVKTVCMGEGGAVTTNDAALAERLRSLRAHGITRDPARFSEPEQAFAAEGGPNPWYYEMRELGFNYRASDINCALGLSQLGKLARFGAARRALAERYDRLLARFAPSIRPVRPAAGSVAVPHLYVALIDFAGLGTTRARVMTALRELGIGTQVHYLPINRQPYYCQRYGPSVLPGADAYYERCLSLPLFPAMTEGDVDRVVEALSTVLDMA